MAIAKVATDPVIEATVPAMNGAKRWDWGLIFLPKRSCLLDAAAILEPWEEFC